MRITLIPTNPVTFSTLMALCIVAGAVLLYKVGALQLQLLTLFITLAPLFGYNSWLLHKQVSVSVLALLAIALALCIAGSAVSSLQQCADAVGGVFACREAPGHIWVLFMGLALGMLAGVHLFVSERLLK